PSQSALMERYGSNQLGQRIMEQCVVELSLLELGLLEQRFLELGILEQRVLGTVIPKRTRSKGGQYEIFY
ncbi:MAG: hypothetical protein MUP03_06820, partial [Anaerolineales bacterium]|nr:hypothetical protein [Anaerolineales bacterium]